MTRIVTTVGRCGPGRTCGAERMAERSTRALAAAGHVVTLVEPDGPWPVDAPDVIHAFDLADPEPVRVAHDRAQRLDVPFVLTPATIAGLWPDPELSGQLCRAARTVFALSRQEARALSDLGVAPDRIRLVPSAPDLTGTPEPERFRRRYGLDGDIVLFLGRRLPSKGFHTLLEAAPQVLRSHPRTRFVFAGPDGMGPPVIGDRLHDVGLLDDQTKHDGLAACSVFCLPTTADVFPLVFLEAWACGRPVVSGPFPGVDEVIRSDVDGVIAAADPASVAAALTGLLSDPSKRERLGSAGHRRVRTELTWDRVAAAYLAGYEIEEAEGRRL